MRPGESSTQIGALASSPTTLARCAYSCDWSSPLRSLCASICPREQSIRWASCCLLISSEKTAHGISESAATLRYVLRRAGPAVVEEHWPGSERGLQLILRLA